MSFVRTRLLVLLALTCASAPVWAASDAERIERLEQRQQEIDAELEKLRTKEDPTEEQRTEEIERRQGILTEELRRLRDALVLPESKELKSAYGLGPAASKVYQLERGLSIGGYGEANFVNQVSDKSGADTFDFLRFVLYFGYKYNDWIVLNSEIEFEHASSEGSGALNQDDGSVSVEFATLDFLLHPAVNVRAGMVLVPVGFLNEIHEPPFFHGNVRPMVEQRIIPSTWRSNGFGLFGEPLTGLEYRMYGITSLDAQGFSSNGVRDGRQKGNRERAHDWSFVTRLDYTFLPGSLVGGSLYVGDQGQNREYAGRQADAFMQLYEAHAQVHMYGFEARLLGAVIDLDDAAQLSQAKSDTIAKVQWGWYGELAYDVMPLLLPDTSHYLAPWFRYSRYDTQNSIPDGFTPRNARDRDVYEVGLTYKPIPQVVFKLDYRNQGNKSGNDPDEIRIGGGYVF